ncbi:MAG: hypothetical protein OES18_16065, partial [Deltaproteobacteria bacterium]|nr:hypothetical protein [Deltaproteobacteria bacterium]
MEKSRNSILEQLTRLCTAITRFESLARASVTLLDRKRTYILAGVLLLLCALVYLAACAPTAKRRRF